MFQVYLKLDSNSYHIMTAYNHFWVSLELFSLNIHSGENIFGEKA
jgi:hypothetical protein